MHLEQCPVCQGVGKVLDPFVNPALPQEKRVKICHACTGKGFIQVYDSGDFETLMKIPELKKLVVSQLDNAKRMIDDDKKEKD